ncbi:Gfo/Idh/MocA family protein [Bryobacter aggregatus]|uniref:Gfo/Idh/MocA family protein n=1 Tax=Bryobacter aggregatus TaxID=360054 RepID=UPI0004E1AC69|nr:Gfo/Idh/MocA family oxidoreductase [Bryobacter aggregatus]
MRFPASLLLFFATLLSAAEIRIGIIGTDTSHVGAFTKILNDPKNPDYVPGVRVVAAYKGGSKDIESSAKRIDQYANELAQNWNVEIVPDIATLLSKVDVVLLESVDGRTHLEQAKPIIAAGKPFFIDKPLASRLEDAVEIARLARSRNVKWFTSSSLRWAKSLAPLQQQPLKGALIWGPGPLEEHHYLDLSWYGIHAAEMLFTVMGRGCETVTRIYTPDQDEVSCVWSDGRVGTVRTLRPYADFGAVGFQKDNKVLQTPTKFEYSYVPLVREIVQFFKTGQAPVDPAESIEIFAFLDAAQKSREQGGKPVKMTKPKF